MNHVPVVTGASRGLGAHLVDALLDRGTAKVYAFARDTTKVRQDPRVVAVAFDLQQPPTVPEDVTLLINNASTAEFAGPLDALPEAVAREMAINYEGTYATIRAFLPTLEANGGALVNVLSLLSLASTPPMAGYSASKAAMHSLTQALRPVLRERGDQRPRRLPGRDRHRDGRGHRGTEDRAARGRGGPARRHRRTARRTSSPTPTRRR